MTFLLRILLIICLASPAFADKKTYLRIADRGWNYVLRATMVGRDMSIPVTINGRSFAGTSICVVGDKPHPIIEDVINQFRNLNRSVHGKPLPMRFAGPSAQGCGTGRTVILRLYSGFPPNARLSDDLEWMNRAYDLGLPTGRRYAAASPAMGQTFFGRRGQATHIMVQQPATAHVSEIEALYHRSILIEELFQTFTFGMDVAHFDRHKAFVSKLEEWPFMPLHIAWNSPEFMRALLTTNPIGLCEFDIFMMHAIARSPTPATNSDAFIAFIDRSYSDLMALARQTLENPLIGSILDPDCSPHHQN